MALLDRPPLETIPPARERWTPIYLEHGRIEVDDSSVKWIGADRTILRLPVASLSALLLGPGTTVTHDAMKACAECDTPVCWVGANGMRFYATGAKTSHDNERARLQAELSSNPKTQAAIARKMFAMRFSDVDVSKYSVKELRGFEGRRVKRLYETMGLKYGVTWKGRRYDPNNWDLADNVNKAVSAANAALYSLTLAVVTSMGYLPQLGFIHTAGSLPFVYDIADIYKPVTTLPAAFETLSMNPSADSDSVVTRLKFYLEKERILERMPLDCQKLVAHP